VRALPGPYRGRCRHGCVRGRAAAWQARARCYDVDKGRHRPAPAFMPRALGYLVTVTPRGPSGGGSPGTAAAAASKSAASSAGVDVHGPAG
jgi:hypothetical protein